MHSSLLASPKLKLLAGLNSELDQSIPKSLGLCSGLSICKLDDDISTLRWLNEVRMLLRVPYGCVKDVIAWLDVCLIWKSGIVGIITDLASESEMSASLLLFFGSVFSQSSVSIVAIDWTTSVSTTNLFLLSASVLTYLKLPFLGNQNQFTNWKELNVIMFNSFKELELITGKFPSVFFIV